MAEESKEQYEFKKKVKALKEFSGRGTELISVYVTPGYSLNEIAAKLRDEQGQASNIKSKSTRQNVVDALEKILQYLKGFKATPANGIAIF
ncbi:MAG: peptide chain release factor 1, partial [Candidatus Micrarchaeota archaeon]